MITLVDSAMASWAADTRHYLVDGQHLAVHVSGELNETTLGLINESLELNGIPTIRSGIHKVVVEPTTIFECTEEGFAITLTPIHTLPPGTAHEEALALAGYE